MPNPVDTPLLYDYVTMCGQASPGICKVVGFKRAQKWDIKDGQGQDGATTTLQGDVISKGSIKIFLWKDQDTGFDHFAAYDTWRRIFVNSIGDKSRGLDIYYPDLDRIGVRSVSIEAEGIPEHDGKGGAWITIDLLEFKPPKPKPASTPDASVPQHDGPDPNQDILDKINGMVAVGKSRAKARGSSVFFDPASGSSGFGNTFSGGAVPPASP